MPNHVGLPDQVLPCPIAPQAAQSAPGGLRGGIAMLRWGYKRCRIGVAQVVGEADRPRGYRELPPLQSHAMLGQVSVRLRLKKHSMSVLLKSFIGNCLAICRA